MKVVGASTLWVVVTLLMCCCCSCLNNQYAEAIFADQAGLTDYQLKFVGHIQHAIFTTHNNSLLVGTGKGVIASLDNTLGTIHSRIALPEEEGSIQFLTMASSSNSFFSLSGNGQRVRRWKVDGMNIVWDSKIRGNPDVNSMNFDIIANGIVSAEDPNSIAVLSQNTVFLLSFSTGKQVWEFTPPDQSVIITKISVDTLGAYVLATAEVFDDDNNKHTVVYRIHPKTGKSERVPCTISDAASTVLLYSLSASYVSSSSLSKNPTDMESELKLRNIMLDTEASLKLGKGSWVMVNPGAPKITIPGTEKNTIQMGPFCLHGRKLKDYPEKQVIAMIVASASKILIFGVLVHQADLNPFLLASLDISSFKDTTFIVQSQLSTLSILKSSESLSIATIKFPETKISTPLKITFSSLPKQKDTQLSRVPMSFSLESKTNMNVGLIVFDDHSASLIQYSNNNDVNDATWLWTREEALASVVQVESLELPRAHVAGDIDKAIELEKGIALFARWNHQLTHLRDLTNTVFTETISLGEYAVSNIKLAIRQISNLERPSGLGATEARPLSENEKERFGFNRIFILSCENGMLYALHSESSKILWRYQLGEKGRVLVTREREFGADHPPEVVVLLPSQNKAIWLNALNGLVVMEESFQGQGSIMQVMIIKSSAHVGDHHKSEHRNVILYLDSKNQPYLLPKGDSSVQQVLDMLVLMKKKSLIVWYINKQKTSIFGFQVRVNEKRELFTIPLWSIVAGENEKYVNVASMSSNDVIASAAKGLGDLSVLIKHINPNLIAVASIIKDPNSGAKTLRMALLDIVTGFILKRYQHVDGSEPVLISRYENFIVYSFWNTKTLRTEVSSVALFDGAIDKWGLNPVKYGQSVPLQAVKNGETSSYDLDPDAPIAMQRSFFLPGSVRSMTVTSTRLGIASKNMIFGLNSGQILMMDQRFLDPRRPANKPLEHEQEEGLIQYFPELPIIPTSVVSYSRDIERPQLLHVSKTMLESTSLVLSCGLDLFYVRTNPSKGFDVLPEDFNYMLLVFILVTLSVLVWIARVAVMKSNLSVAFK